MPPEMRVNADGDFYTGLKQSLGAPTLRAWQAVAIHVRDRCTALAARDLFVVYQHLFLDSL